ncbi:MAG TPA: threonylcarbamoyl-AMP synthase [Bacteroidales bacterium]|nr:threonylcarbamoyl-AMP synthase [Bacteroidales bacterium]
MLIKIYPENPSDKLIAQAVQVLKNDGIIIYPTDTVYALGCNIHSRKALEKIARLKSIRVEKAQFSFIFYDLSDISLYTKHFDNNVFKLMKKNLPGPFTFILPASNEVPKIFMAKKKTIGVRIPDNNIIRQIVKELGNPILTTSIHSDDNIMEYFTDPELIHEKYELLVDLVIDGGFGNIRPSTVVDCTGDQPEVVREGVGELHK